MDNTHVTILCKKSNGIRWQTLRLRGEEFLRRFVMHVLPRGFHKVRYYGLWHHSQRETRNRIRLLLAPPIALTILAQWINPSFASEQDQSLPPLPPNEQETLPSLPPCPYCQSCNVRCIEVLTRNRSP
jgi:hypothetical protein